MFYSGQFFGGNFYESGPLPDDVVNTGGKGDNKEIKRRGIFKPTGLLDRKPRASAQAPVPSVDGFPNDVVDLSVKQVERVTNDGVKVMSLRKMSRIEMTNEIKLLMGKSYRSDEEEALLLIFMEAI